MRGTAVCRTTITSFALLMMLHLVAFSFHGSEAAENGFKTVTTDQLKMMMDDKKDFVLIDTRTREEFQEAHIAQAVNIPEKNFEEQASLLPKDKDELIVLYCNGVKCGKSKKAAKKAEGMGYRNIVVYAEGFPVWEERGYKIVPGPEYSKKIETTRISPSELKKLIDAHAGGYVLVDVRDEVEFKEGHIPTAINIPVETFASRSDILPKEKTIIVYCNSGGRSYNAYRKLMKLAYPSIAQAIFAEWKEAEMAVAR